MNPKILEIIPFSFFVCFLFYSTILTGQSFQVTKQVELADNSQEGKSIEHIHTVDAVIITEKLDRTATEISLNNLLTNKKTVIERIQSSPNSKIYVELSNNGQFVVYAYQDLEKRKYLSKIYNISSQAVTVLEHEAGDVANVSLSTQNGDILYEIREKGRIPQIHRASKNGTGSEFVTYGVAPIWSPDGKWFVCIPMTEKNVHPKERYLKGEITRAQFIKEKEELLRKVRQGEPIGLPLYIFDSKGNKQIELQEFGGIHGEFQWSPQSDKLAFIARDRSMSSIGLTIVDLTVKANQIQSYKTEFVSYSGYYPSWSPNGKYLAYTEIAEGSEGYTIVNKDVYILDMEHGKKQNLTKTASLFEERATWDGNNNLILTKENKTILFELAIQ